MNGHEKIPYLLPKLFLKTKSSLTPQHGRKPLTVLQVPKQNSLHTNSENLACPEDPVFIHSVKPEIFFWKSRAAKENKLNSPSNPYNSWEPEVIAKHDEITLDIKIKRKSTNLLQRNDSRENKFLYTSTFLLCITQFICSWDTWVGKYGSISCLIAINFFGLSHRTSFLLNTTTKQQNKSCFAQVLAKAVEGTPPQKESIMQIGFGSISGRIRGRSFQDQNNTG